MNKERNAKYIYDELVKAGVTPEGACGVIGNLEAESGLNPKNLEDTKNHKTGMTDDEYTAAVDNGTYTNFWNDGYGYGLAQWTAKDRKPRLMTFMKSRGYSIGQLEGQVEYLIWELKNYFPRVWERLQTVTSVRGASNDILLRFEIPADQGPKVQEYRVSLSEHWYEKFVAGTVPVEDEPEPQKNEYWPPRMIDKSMTGADVSMMQAILNCRGYGCRIDGIFGDEADKKLRQFQKDMGLVADGVCGPKSWTALLSTQRG